MNRWKVRKWRNYGLAKVNIWEVFDPHGVRSAAFENWDQAMDYAAHVGTRLEFWLEHQR